MSKYNACTPHKMSYDEVEDIEEISGHGVSAVVFGRRILVGNENLMNRSNIVISSIHDEGTVCYIAVDGIYAGCIVISDYLKESAKEAIADLKSAGIKTVMLTGDSEKAATRIAKEVGVDRFCSELLPGDKVAEVEKMLEGMNGKEKLAFCGDGINDAPVLMRADIGIAMGGLGSDAAIEAADIVLMVHDIMCGRDDTFGFSIKSQLGSPSTLFNASGTTNFTYKLKGHKLSNDEIATFNGFKMFADKFEFLDSIGTDIEFVTTDNKTLEFNLKMVTSEMPQIFAEMIENYYMGKSCMLSELIEIIADSGVINTMNNKVYLRHKVKELLTNIALGMVPGTLWTGDYEATGGYIIVKDDGDVVCYHIYNRNAFRNYLLANTRFDTPSKSRHGFGTIYEENAEQFLKLNVQIRFIK